MLEIVLAVVVIALAAMVWQQLRYLRIRRNSAQDRQKLWHSSDAFHVIVFFKLPGGARVVDTVRHFLQLIDTNSTPRLIYAGEAACTVHSKQLGNSDWDGVLLLEYPTRKDYQDSIALGHIVRARASFADSYLYGMRRSRQSNLSIPWFLLRRRLLDILSGKWRTAALVPSTVFATFPEYDIWRLRAARLRAFNAINSKGLVVYSLVKRGNRQQQANSALFDRQMASLMAAQSHGPLHMGRPVALEDLARFDQVLGVHYPSAEYFADLLGSQFFDDITASKQLGDYLAVFTIPITDRL
jgi:hypothetical protein